ncbi:Vacuolar protein sorting-associated protein 52 [Tritrichomonas musculus]|uniref:Vacuolar protein sorting-associated protein 52 n=1 Tax=Tritrichomonas musculus TaxID=1915356 RepID=A0ABR2KE46_9EUKA
MTENEIEDESVNANDLDIVIPEIEDITTRKVNFDEMEEDIERFASNEAVRAVLEKGVDLQNYGSKIQEDLEEAEQASINDYLNQVERVESLHQEISTCDHALATMEDLLMQFKEALGQITTDIKSLQSKSQELTVKLNNRKEVDKYLHEFTRNVTITPEFQNTIIKSDVGFNYVKFLVELDQKIKFVKSPDVRKTQAARECSGPLEKLKNKASDNIKKWITLKTNQLRDAFTRESNNPNNIDFEPDSSDKLSIQNSMLRCKFVFKFLKDHSPDIQQSTRNYYIDIVSKIYLDMFKSMSKKLTNQMAQISMSPETIVPVQNQRSSVFKSKRQNRESTLFFSIGDRQKLLNDVLAPPQIFTLDSYPVEALMRSLYQSFIDIATSEHVFSSEFFYDENISGEIFSPTTTELEQFLDKLLAKITDPICIVLLYRFAIAHKNEMDRRKITKFDGHFRAVMAKLRSRFSAIVANNQNTIEQCDPKIFLENEATAHHANAMTKRFSEFASSLSQLMNDETSDMITTELHMISAAVIDLIERTSREFKNNELAVVFQINNYYLILTTLQTVNGCPLIDLFQQKLSDCSSYFVELEIKINFPKLVETVRRAFTKLETREEPLNTGIGESELKEIAMDFKNTHIDKMKQIADSQMLKFGDFQNGKMILQIIAKRLVLYWAKFDQLCRFVMKGASPGWFSNLISSQQLVFDIKPMTDSF